LIVLQNWKEYTCDENSFQFIRILPLNHKMMWSLQEIHPWKGEYITCLLMMTLPSNSIGILPSFWKWCYPLRSYQFRKGDYVCRNGRYLLLMRSDPFNSLDSFLSRTNWCHPLQEVHSRKVSSLLMMTIPSNSFRTLPLTKWWEF
jgi:hypothetical protein